MKRILWLIFFSFSICAPLCLLTQTPSDSENHVEAGVLPDYFRLSARGCPEAGRIMELPCVSRR